MKTAKPLRVLMIAALAFSLLAVTAPGAGAQEDIPREKAKYEAQQHKRKRSPAKFRKQPAYEGKYIRQIRDQSKRKRRAIVN